MKLGVASPRFTAKFKKQDFSDLITSFSYSHAEETDDVCQIELTMPDHSVLDSGAFRRDAEWVVSWGYAGEVGISHSEKIYLEEITPEFSDTGLSVTIVGHDKPARLRKIKTRGTANNASLPAYITNKAADQGIKTKLDIPSANTSKVKDGVAKAALNVFQRNALTRQYEQEKRNSSIEVYPGIYRDYWEARPSKEEQEKYKNLARAAVESGMSPQTLEKKLWYMDKFITHKQVVEGGRSVVQVGKSLARRDPNGPYILTGHGDTITIRKRNLNKKPIHKYTYGQEPGELLRFRPSTKNKSQTSAATSVGFTGWDAINKKAYTSNVLDGSNPNVDSLLGGGVINSSINSKDFFTTATGNGQSGPFTRGFYNQASAVRDNLAAPIRSIVLSPKLNNTPEQKPSKPTPATEILSGHQDPVQSLSTAANKQANAALEQNPGSLVVVMNPKLLSGEVVQIENVGKKFSGNYYILKSTHKWSSGSHATTEMEIVRNSVAITKGLTASESTSSTPVNKKEADNNNRSKSPKVKLD